MSTTLQNIATTKISTKLQEPFSSEAINKRSLVAPRGVVRGFLPEGTGVADEVRFAIDARSSDSLALVGGTAGITVERTLTVRESGAVTLTLAGAGVYYVGIVVDYTTGAVTTGEYVSYTQGEFNGGDPGTDGATLLCRVDYAGGAIVAGDIALAKDDFLRDEQKFTQATTQGGVVKCVASIDFGDPAGWFHHGTDSPAGSILRDEATFQTGFGSLQWDPTAGAQGLTLWRRLLIPARQDDRVYGQVLHQTFAGGVDFGVGLSRIQFEEYDTDGVAGSDSFTDTQYDFVDTGGTFERYRYCYTVQDAATAYVTVKLSYVSAGALSPALRVDGFEVFSECLNEDLDGANEKDRGKGAEGLVSTDLTIRDLSPTVAGAFKEPYRLQNRADVLELVRDASGSSWEIGDVTNPIATALFGTTTFNGPLEAEDVSSFADRSTFEAGLELVSPVNPDEGTSILFKGFFGGDLVTLSATGTAAGATLRVIDPAGGDTKPFTIARVMAINTAVAWGRASWGGAAWSLDDHVGIDVVSTVATSSLAIEIFNSLESNMDITKVSLSATYGIPNGGGGPTISPLAINAEIDLIDDYGLGVPLAMVVHLFDTATGADTAPPVGATISFVVYANRDGTL